MYIRVVLRFKQKLCVRGFPISILRFQGNKLKKSFRGFKKLIVLWKLIEWFFAGLLNFSASKYSGTLLVINFKIPENCECFSLLTRKNSVFCYRICILRNRRNILVGNILVEEYSGKNLFLVWAKVLLLVLLELHLKCLEVNWNWEKRVKKKFPANSQFFVFSRLWQKFHLKCCYISVLYIHMICMIRFSSKFSI